MDNVTAIIVTFMRYDYAIDCIRSLRKSYPNINILVGEQSDSGVNQVLQEVCSETNSKLILLPHDYGVGASRNLLIKKAKTKYVLIGDDDFLYDRKAKLEKMYEFLEATGYDLIGGRIIQDGIVRNYQGFIEIHKDHIKTTPIIYPERMRQKVCGLRFMKCDLTFNFFIARKDVVMQNPWDENIKVAYEHHHFFIGLKKANKLVAFSPDPLVKHKFQKYPIPREYKYYRMRRQDKDYYFKSLGIDYSICINGQRENK